MNTFKLYIYPVMAIAMIIVGCSDKATCIPENSDLLQLAFVDEFGKAKSIDLLSIEAEGSNENFPIISDSTLTTIALPLNPLEKSIKLTFVQESISNILILSYLATPLLISPECGLETKFDFVDVDSSNFIDVQIVNQTLNESIATNVRITH